MSEPRIFQIATVGQGAQIPVGERVSLPANETGDGFSVIPDPDGEYIVVSCNASQIEVERLEEP